MFAPLAVARRKRQRASDGARAAASGLSTPLRQDPPSSATLSPHNSVSRISTSASSCGSAHLSDSEGDAEGDDVGTAAPHSHNSPASSASVFDPATGRSTSAAAAQPPPSKRLHLDEATSGRFASMKLEPNGLHRSPCPTPGAPAGNHQHHLFRGSTRRGVGSLFGQAHLPHAISADLAPLGFGTAPASSLAAPPSSPIKTSVELAPLSAAIATMAPPASPEQRPALYAAPPASPIQALASKGGDAWPPLTVETRDGDIEDLDMRIRRGPTSYEIEPDRIVVNSLDDTSSSENGGDNDTPDARTPEPRALGHFDFGGGVGEAAAMDDFVVNKELMDKLEAHRRAVLTGTSDRDNEQSARDAKTANGRSSTRRCGRRSGGGGGGGGLFGSLGPLPASRRRSAQSSQASSPGYTTPITNEEATGALVLWKDPEEVLKATSASIAAASGAGTGNGAAAHVPSTLRQESSHSMGGGSFWSTSGGPRPASSPASGFGGIAFSFGDSTSPLGAQQSSPSSSYFGEPRNAWPSSKERVVQPPQAQQQHHQEQQPSWSGDRGYQPTSTMQPLLEGDPSSHFGMADEMELDG